MYVCMYVYIYIFFSFYVQKHCISHCFFKPNNIKFLSRSGLDL